MNHWKPEGAFFVGDCMPFYKDGKFHLYYLLDEGHHNHPIVGALGGHQWAHAVSSDLVHWEELPMALPLDFENGECSNCTGSLLEWNGKVYAFYALRSKHFSGEEFRVAVSEDGGETFQKWDLPELKTPPEGRTGDFRDPTAFLDKNGLIHILMSTALPLGNGNTPLITGELAHFTTTDLIHYQQEPSLLHSWIVPECSDYFQWGKYYYLLFGVSCETHYRYAEAPFGPWKAAKLDVPACPLCRVMKTIPWKNGRRIGVGWSPTWENGNFLFGGRTLFREMIQRDDGTLTTSFVTEMLPGDNEKTLESIDLENLEGISWKTLGTFPDSFRLDGEIHFSENTLRFGLAVMDHAQDYKRFIDFDPQAHIVELDRHTQIRQVDMKNGVLSFRLIRTHELIDLEINGERTIASPYIDFSGSLTAFYVIAGHARLEKLKLFTEE